MLALTALPSLIATDLDGTLLRADGSISERTQLALKRARAAGVELVMVTGRPARHVANIDGVADFGGVVICVNGALIYDLDHDRVVQEVRLSGALACELVLALRRELPGVCFAVEVGLEYGWESSYGRQRKRTESPPLPIADALVLCERGVNKLIARHAELPTEQLIRRAREVLADRATVSFSGAPFVEIGSRNASKAFALAAYCAERKIERARVLSFGDMPNDLPMLEWAGHSVAMANAHASVLSTATETTRSNEEDGVAWMIEGLLSRYAPQMAR